MFWYNWDGLSSEIDILPRLLSSRGKIHNDNVSGIALSIVTVSWFMCMDSVARSLCLLHGAIKWRANPSGHYRYVYTWSRWGCLWGNVVHKIQKSSFPYPFQSKQESKVRVSTRVQKRHRLNCCSTMISYRLIYCLRLVQDTWRTSRQREKRTSKGGSQREKIRELMNGWKFDQKCSNGSKSGLNREKCISMTIWN